MYPKLPAYFDNLRKFDVGWPTFQVGAVIRISFSCALLVSTVNNGSFTMTKKKEKWYLYLARCSDKSIYTGIAKNVNTRIERHNQGKGALYTASRRPISLIYQEEHSDRVSAMKREIEIKRWPRKKKVLLAIGE